MESKNFAPLSSLVLSYTKNKAYEVCECMRGKEKHFLLQMKK